MHRYPLPSGPRRAKVAEALGAAVLGLVSGIYIFKTPLEEYHAARRAAIAGGGAPGAGGAGSGAEAKSETKSE